MAAKTVTTTTPATGKRPIRSLSAHEKLDAIRRVHEGESKASVARDIGVPESTLRGWCKNENKISYLSRQSSSPEGEEGHVVEEKRQRMNNTPPSSSSAAVPEPQLVQPFNLSLKGATYASEALYTPIDYSKSDLMDSAPPKTPQNLSIKTETPKSTASQVTEGERNRAELQRLSIELGLNRPELFKGVASSSAMTTSSTSMSDLATNLTLLSQWNNLMMQQQLLAPKKATPDTTTTLTAHSVPRGAKPPKEQQPMEDYIRCWLKTQESILVQQQQQPKSSTTTNGTTPSSQNSWFWKCYKQLYQTPPPPTPPEKPILYKQLTKDSEVENNPSPNNNNNKARSVLDNLLLINNNNLHNNNNNRRHLEDKITQTEALQHGERFMQWLESCSDPSITAVQIMQFRGLLNNVRSGVDRKNNVGRGGDAQQMHQINKTKVKRK